MPVSITIRDVPDEVRDALAARARLSGQSLQEYLRTRLITLASKPEAATVVAQIRARLAVTGAVTLTAEEIVDLVKGDRR